MALPWLAIAAGAQIGSALFGGSATRRAGREAKELGRLNEKYITEETAEQSRRLRFSQGRTTSRAKAGFAASGFRSGAKSMGGSQKAYLQTLRDVQQSEMAWLQKSGQSRATIARKGGEAAASQLNAQAIGMFGQALTGAAGLAYGIQQGTSGYGG